MKQLSNAHLIQQLKHLVSEERNLTAQVLEYLREVELRKLFLELGYSSLFEFCMKELQYSEGSAQRRISAMRLLKDVPEVEEKIISGELSLSVLSQAQSFFKKQEKQENGLNKIEKLELLEKLENTSARGCEAILLELDPEPVTQDKERALTPDLTEIKLTVDREFTDKLEKLKNLLSHSSPDISTKGILKMALDYLLEKKNPTVKAAKKTSSPPASAAKPSRYISNQTKKMVWLKSEGKCCYINSKTGYRCNSKRFLEIDHIRPHSKGGPTEAENLQLLCDAHNRWKSNKLPESQNDGGTREQVWQGDTY